MKILAEGPWNRPERIVLAIDIGTTSSSVTFAYLSPGAPQLLHRVTAWPGQESRRGESKVPTLMYYDANGNPVSFGAEALGPETEDIAEDEGWHLVRHFKLHVQPGSMWQEQHLKAQPLPPGLSLLKIYTDFMVYLLKCTKEFFECRMVDGQRIWRDFRQDMTIVLAHPNDWGLKEKNFLRQAAVAAKLAPQERAISQIQFVAEAEAYVHLCMSRGDLRDRLSPNATFLVCDAGESTVGITVCTVKSISPVLEIEKAGASARAQTGNHFVEIELEAYLTRILSQLEQLDRQERIDYIENGVKDFRTAQKTFESGDSECRVDLGAGRLNKPELRIRRGTITLDGAVVESFFHHSVAQVVAAIRQQMSEFSFKHILLLGKFGETPYLRKTLISQFGKDCAVCVPSDSMGHAFADGAVVWSATIMNSVAGRVTQVSYGVEINDKYDPRNAEHLGRSVHRRDAGYEFVIGRWSQIIGKGIVLSPQETIRRPYWRSYKTGTPHLNEFKLTIFASSHDNDNRNGSQWLRDKQGRINEGFVKVCKVKFDLSVMRQALRKKTAQHGDYWYLDFTVALQFGGTGLQVSVEWEQNGEIRTGPASVIPISLANAWA